MGGLLVFGSEGFVGRTFQSIQGAKDLFLSDISAASKKNYMKCDVRIRTEVDAVLKTVQPSLILYLTAQSSVKRSFDDPCMTFDINIKGLLNILESVKAMGIKPYFVYVSTIEVYRKSNDKITEKTQYAPENPYAISKDAGEKIVNLYKKTGIIDGIIVQPVSHIGPGQTKDFSISSFAYQVASAEKNGGDTVLVGNLDVTRDILDVRDVISFYAKLLQQRPLDLEKMIVSSGNGYRYQEILEMLIGISNKKDLLIRTDPSRLRPVDNNYLVASPSYAISKLGWNREIGIEKTLGDMLEYWRDNI